MQNHEVKAVWSTPNGANIISEIARLSNPKNAKNFSTAPRLLRYLIKHKHWSPFEMASMCISIKTSRAIGRQLLRHRSFSFQEFSQRYADPGELNDFELGITDARLQDTKNRQNSIETDDSILQVWWEKAQRTVLDLCLRLYDEAIDRGIAKEVARVILPEGLTSTHIYMNGNIRSWMHFCMLRCGNGTQKETTKIANAIRELVAAEYPDAFEALDIDG